MISTARLPPLNQDTKVYLNSKPTLFWPRPQCPVAEVSLYTHTRLKPSCLALSFCLCVFWRQLCERRVYVPMCSTYLPVSFISTAKAKAIREGEGEAQTAGRVSAQNYSESRCMVSHRLQPGFAVLVASSVILSVFRESFCDASLFVYILFSQWLPDLHKPQLNHH